MNFHRMGLVVATLLSISCTGSPERKMPERSDPLEKFNRAMFNFNFNVLDPYVVKPVAVVWQNYVPAPARRGLSNSLSNLEEPASMINGFLVGDPYCAMIHFSRFFLNTLAGMGGLIDVASLAHPGLAKTPPARFGSTLGRYGVGYGPYVMLPGYGSFTLRDEGGKSADTFYPVLSYLTFWVSAGTWMLQAIDARAQLLNSDTILRDSPDPYLTVREAYFQRHDFLATGGALKTQVNPNAQAIENDLENIDATFDSSEKK